MSTLRGVKCCVLGAVMLGLLSCSKPVLEGARLEALAEVASQVNQDNLKGLVTELVDAHHMDTVDCPQLVEAERHDRAHCALSRNRSGELLQTRLEQLGLRVRRQETAGTPFSTSNIVAELPGSTHPEEIILVGAHYDAFHDGADDNTTGVAALVEMARVLSQYKFERTLRFVGFDHEEFGLIGSARYVQAEGNLPERIVATMVFDCLGYYDSRPGSQASLPGLPTPPAGDFLAVIANDTSSQRASEVYALNEALKLMKVVPLIAPRDGTGPLTGNLMRSDHASFWVQDHEALFLTDTANFRNPNYHQATDTLDTLDFTSYQQAVRISAATVAYWAGGPQP
ncbi:M28 family metallopeptidase [Archangium sp.]|uniref:M28 family metallopeptidase n=1 Tax=Archangium sp. TaxID=1872627 RepID=UPI00389A2465